LSLTPGYRRRIVSNHCCERLAHELEAKCSQHANCWDCMDALIGYWPDSGKYGLIVHDGGGSMVIISFCPWCGTDLGPFGERKATVS
jgi:hypothetical protein